MKKITIIIIAVIALFTGCQPNVTPPPNIIPVKEVEKDTVLVRDTIIRPVFRFNLIDSAGNSYIVCNGLTSEFPVKNLHEIVIHVAEDKELSYLRVNNKVFYEKEVRAYYRYNTKGDVIVSKGNTVLEICRDHDITIEQFKEWNPKINVDNLKLNQIVHVGQLPEN